MLCAKHGPEADSTPPLPQGRRLVFKGGGLDPRYDKRGGGGGGGGVLSSSGPIRKAGGGGGEAVRFRPDTKSGVGWGVGVGVCAVHFRHNRGRYLT